MHVVPVDFPQVFQALADSTRLRIVRLLAATKEEVCLCELVDSLLEPQYKLSRHVKILKQSGLLMAQKEGRWVYHRLVDDQTYLEALYAAVAQLPDSRREFAADMARFRARMRLRKAGRCRLGIQSGELAMRA